MIQEQLDALVAKWSEILRLQDWDVKIYIDNLIGDDRFGQSNWVFERKSGIITLKNPDYTNPEIFKSYPYVPERTIIHELLHLHFAFLDKYCSDNYIVLEPLLEQALCSLAQAFYNLAQQKENEKQ